MIDKLTPRIEVIQNYKETLCTVTGLTEMKKIFPSNAAIGATDLININEIDYSIEEVIFLPFSEDSKYNLEIIVHVAPLS